MPQLNSQYTLEEFNTAFPLGEMVTHTNGNSVPRYNRVWNLSNKVMMCIVVPHDRDEDKDIDAYTHVLATRLTQASEIRYTMRYMGVSQECKELAAGCKATVDVLIDASFTIQNAMGKASRPDKRDQNQLLLEWNGSRWMFLAGM